MRLDQLCELCAVIRAGYGSQSPKIITSSLPQTAPKEPSFCACSLYTASFSASMKFGAFLGSVADAIYYFLWLFSILVPIFQPSNPHKQTTLIAHNRRMLYRSRLPWYSHCAGLRGSFELDFSMNLSFHLSVASQTQKTKNTSSKYTFFPINASCTALEAFVDRPRFFNVGRVFLLGRQLGDCLLSVSKGLPLLGAMYR